MLTVLLLLLVLLVPKPCALQLRKLVAFFICFTNQYKIGLGKIISVRITTCKARVSTIHKKWHFFKTMITYWFLFYFSKLLNLIEIVNKNIWRPVRQSPKDPERNKKENLAWGHPQQRGMVHEQF